MGQWLESEVKGATEKAWVEANAVIPGGVNTSLRRFDPPMVFERASGAYLFDVDGKQYVDYHAAFGSVLLGHNHPEVNARVSTAMGQLDLVGAGTTRQETMLAERIVQLVPSAEKVVFCNSGSQATFTAIRLARAVTGRSKLIKFQGCYHGWSDPVAMNVISPPELIGKKHPLSAGLGPDVRNTIVLEYNDLAAVTSTFEAEGSDIAAVILEPIAHNIGCVVATDEFLAGLRDLCDRYSSILIMDEVITGFRHSLGGYQSICGVTPDLTAMGKAMANGYPMSALAGRADLMDRLDTYPGGDTFFAGTFNAHVYSTTASLATIDFLEDGTIHRRLFELGERLSRGLQELLDKHGFDATVVHFGSVVVPCFLTGPIRSFTDLLRGDNALDVAFRKAMVDRGFFMIPTALKRIHISASHTQEDIDRTLQAADDALASLAEQGHWPPRTSDGDSPTTTVGPPIEVGRR